MSSFIHIFWDAGSSFHSSILLPFPGVFPRYFAVPFCSACNPPMVTLRSLCSQVSAFAISDTSIPLDLTRCVARFLLKGFRWHLYLMRITFQGSFILCLLLPFCTNMRKGSFYVTACVTFLMLHVSDKWETLFIGRLHNVVLAPMTGQSLFAKFAAQNSYWRRQHLAGIPTGLLRTISSGRTQETARHTRTSTSSTRRKEHLQTSPQRNPG